MDGQKAEKRYWFVNKKVGIGWVPATWEGWLVTALYVLGVFTWSLSVLTEEESLQEVTIFFIGLFAFTFLLFGIIVRFGEPLTWKFWKKK